MDQKVKQHRFLKYLWLKHTPKKLIQSHLIRPGSGSGSGSATMSESHIELYTVRIVPVVFGT
jgi:hypothetical protein